MAPGVAYSIQPLHVSDTYRWEVAPGTTLITVNAPFRATKARETTSLAGPNEVLYNSLGDPVAPPTNMAAAYTKEGLTSAMQAAARAASISLTKLEIDDSEFPFLVGVICATRDDMEKLKQEIRKMPDYNYTGGTGGNNSYAMNLVHYRAFPNGAAERIKRRLSLREQILFERMHGHQ